MQIDHLIKQKGYEKIEYLLRRHPLTFVPKLILFLTLMAVPFIIYFLINNLFANLFANEIIFPAAILLASIYFLTIYLFFYIQFLEFYLDSWIVTNDRIVDIEQHGLFSQTISELDLYRVQDVTVDVHGVFPTLFKYGNVKVKTASQNVGIIFYDVPHPNVVRQAIVELSDLDRHHHYGTKP